MTLLSPGGSKTAVLTTYLAPAAVVKVVVVQAQDGGEVGHQRVRLPAAVLESPPERAHGVTPKD